MATISAVACYAQMPDPGLQPALQPQGVQPQGLQPQGVQPQGLQPQAIQPQARPVGGERAAGVENLDTAIQPSETLGADDLVEMSVSYCPELTRTFRVSSDGTLSLPLVHHKLKITGLSPSEVSDLVRKTLVEENIMADPSVNVSVLEYRSRPVSVTGSVQHPLTFQATGNTTLLDAIARAGGMTPTAGGNIIVTDTHISAAAAASGNLQSNVKVIPVRALLSGANPKYNLRMTGGEEIRIPEASKIFIGGDVKKPGVYLMQSDAETTVSKAIALSGGLDAFSSRLAYICRRPNDGGECAQIEVPLKDIMSRKAPDITLAADDYLYVPTSNGKKITVRVLNDLAGFGSNVGAGLMIYH